MTYLSDIQTIEALAVKYLGAEHLQVIKKKKSKDEWIPRVIREIETTIEHELERRSLARFTRSLA